MAKANPQDNPNRLAHPVVSNMADKLIRERSTPPSARAPKKKRKAKKKAGKKK